MALTQKRIDEINDFFASKGIESEEDDHDEYVWVKCCALGDNFYDYGEKPPYTWRIDDKEVREFIQKNSECIRITGCEDCCNCAGW